MENSVIAQKYTKTNGKMEVDTRRQMGGRIGGRHQEKSVGYTFRQDFDYNCRQNFRKISTHFRKFPLVLNLVIDQKSDH